MSDLISRSELIGKINMWAMQCNAIDSIVMLQAVVDVIEKQPIAYDKEAVVEQLENEEKFWESSYDYQIGKQKARSYRHAIELVKAGGIDANRFN